MMCQRCDVIVNWYKWEVFAEDLLTICVVSTIVLSEATSSDLRRQATYTAEYDRVLSYVNSKW